MQRGESGEGAAPPGPALPAAMASPLAPPPDPGPDALYCSTSGTYFADAASLHAHYKSDFHR